MDYRLAENLEKIGLQDNEVKIYLALLETGQGTVAQIAKTAQLNRTTGYDILERLALYGLASRTTSGKKQMYISEPPSRLKKFLENKKTLAESRLAKAEELVSDLQSLYKKESRPVIKFFEGRNGIKNIYWHTLEAKSTIYSVIDFSVYLPEFDEFGKLYVKERSRLKIKEKALVVKNKKGLYFYNTTYKNFAEHQKFQEYRWLNSNLGLIPAAEINIYDDIVMGILVKPGENVAFEIKNASFANSLKIIFELAWEQGEKIK